MFTVKDGEHVVNMFTNEQPWRCTGPPGGDAAWGLFTSRDVHLVNLVGNFGGYGENSGIYLWLR